MKGVNMNVLSLFDGMSCGQIALKELGAKVDKYYASEIDKFAIEQTQHNFPNTIQLGSVTDVKAKNLEKIDLLIGGSPCQGFSFAGKQLNFDDPRSALFFEFVRLWKEVKKINPDAKFLLENVNMRKEHLRVISEYLGVFPVRINSNLVSAQNRDRWYWTNILTKDVGFFDELYSDIPQPEDKGILLKDILQDEREVDNKYFLSDKLLKGLSSHADKRNQEWTFNGANGKGKAITVSHLKQNLDSNYVCVAMRGRGDNNNQQLEPKTDGFRLRRLTPIECSRLQTIPEWYEWVVSDTQIYTMLGNGWTVDVIKHIFSFLE